MKSKKRRLQIDEEHQNEAEFKTNDDEISSKIFLKQCFFQSNSKILGVCLNLTEDKISKIELKYVGLQAWKDKAKHDIISETSHFLPLHKYGDIEKPELKALFRPFRNLLSANPELQKKLESSNKTNSNGVMILIIIGCIYLELVDYFLDNKVDKITNLVTPFEILESLKELMQKIVVLWKNARVYVLTILSQFILRPEKRHGIFITFSNSQKTKENSNKSSCFLLLLLSFSLKNSFHSETFDKLLAYFMNELFVYSVKSYAALNEDFNIQNGNFKNEEELSNITREKVLFQYFTPLLHKILILSYMNGYNKDSKVVNMFEKSKNIKTWNDFLRVLVKNRQKTKYFFKLLLRDYCYFDNISSKDEEKFSVFKLHVLASALLGYHKPIETDQQKLIQLTENTLYKEKLKLFLPEQKALLLKSKLIMVDSSLSEFRKQYEGLEKQKKKLLTSYKKTSVENANLKQEIIDLKESLKALEDVLILEREAGAIENTKIRTNFLSDETEDMKDFINNSFVIDEKGNCTTPTQKKKKVSLFQKYFSCFYLNTKDLKETILEKESEINYLKSKLDMQEKLILDEKKSSTFLEQRSQTLQQRLDVTIKALNNLKNRVKSEENITFNQKKIEKTDESKTSVAEITIT